MAIQNELTATISDGQTESDLVDIGRNDIVGFRFPASYDGTGVTFKAKTLAADTAEDLTFEGTAVDFTAAASARCGCAAEKFACVKQLIIVSDAAQSGADAEIGILVRALAP